MHSCFGSISAKKEAAEWYVGRLVFKENQEDKQKQRRIQLKTKRTHDQVERILWSKTHGGDTYEVKTRTKAIDNKPTQQKSETKVFFNIKFGSIVEKVICDTDEVNWVQQ